mmetsp:Transcript_17585/g.57463  ORF Transcript_17585/g.57463 Transcript_17585/m.57463 type:complete len:239 (-) Transcript_17585:68-784(-)
MAVRMSSRPVCVRALAGSDVSAEQKQQKRSAQPLHARARAALAGAAAASVLAGTALQAVAIGARADGDSIMQLNLQPREAEVLQYSQSTHNGESFTNMDLSGSVWAEAELKEAKFDGSDLRQSIFSRAVLYKASMANADLTSAFFDYAVMRGVDLHGSILAGATFIRSDLGDVNAIDADFTDALIDRYQVLSLCETASGTNPITGADTRESLGCELAEAKRYKGMGAGGKIKVIDANR